MLQPPQGPPGRCPDRGRLTRPAGRDRPIGPGRSGTAAGPARFVPAIPADLRKIAHPLPYSDRSATRF
jgi:hypothetical protein